ncbi:lifeguard 2 protein [Rutstroemia sp. NJR-2017a BBW]|nr:lifeguard 2 protein [Rutstroemia sp. NJR-2017a BBW]
MQPRRDQGVRRRMELNPLTTSLQLAPASHQTPISGNLSAVFGYNPSQYPTPLSSVRQYNPSQWTSSPSVSGGSDGSHYSARQPHDPEVVVPAPPPYSPPRSNRPAGASDEPAIAVSSTPQVYRSSPDTTPTPHTPAPSTPHPNYPPPPGSGRSRAGSSDRPHGIFSFSRRSTNNAENPRMSPPSRSTSAAHTKKSYGASSPSRRTASANQHTAAGFTSCRFYRGNYLKFSSTLARSVECEMATRYAFASPPTWPASASKVTKYDANDGRFLVYNFTYAKAFTDVVVGDVPDVASAAVPAPSPAANWPAEGGVALSPSRGQATTPALHLETSSATSSPGPDSVSGSSSSSLARSRAVRGEKSIRERRSESRQGRTAYPMSAIEPSNNPWAEAIIPSDIVVPLVRPQPIPRATPRSGRSSNVSETPRSSSLAHHNLMTPDRAIVTSTDSRGSTPRPVAPTPPFSPESIKSSTVERSPAVPPKSLPTPPPQPSAAQRSHSSRPPSLIIPRNDSTVLPPSTPSRPATGKSVSSQMSHLTPGDDFARAAAERHEIFAQREASATTDTDRVRIFAEFIVNESRIRRDRYALAIDAMGSEILELTRDLFRPSNRPRRDSTVSRASEYTPQSSVEPRSHRGSLNGAIKDNAQQHPETRSSSRAPSRPGSRSNSRPGSRSNDAGSSSPSFTRSERPETQWWSGYMPSLSPIPSMSVSEALDGADSRGRPASRWWEMSQIGSDGVPSSRFERSKRESKYMGMPKELREALQYGDGDQASSSPNHLSSEPVNPAHLGPNEYPQEKVGFHEANEASPIFHPAAQSPAYIPPTPFTPNPNHLDVSRLVTLPPPYPRHYPAVNNNHPDLTTIRTTVRTLSDISEVTATKERFLRDSAKLQADQESAVNKRRASLRLRIQRDIETGLMTYADAAAQEAEAKTAEVIKSKESAKAIFELFQSQVVLPVNDLLMSRIQSATDLFEQLRGQLFSDSQDQNPTSTQEEGDEQPELIEKLTLLKWIFEAREQLHREVYDLLSDRNDRYAEMIITPYRLANNVEKVNGAEAFFKEDAMKRKQAFESEILKRTEEFMDIVEENVVRGVEVQLGAFWDIAPSLSRLIEQIPENLNGFMIQIPKDEYDENPSYFEFPMQYLYTLLQHTRKSTYQFIESQTNLLCLLHEAKVGVTVANCRLMATQRVAQGEKREEVEKELGAVRREEEGRLTDDLKGKVGVVEELWRSGLGNGLEGVRGRILVWLKSVGGELPEDDEA